MTTGAKAAGTKLRVLSWPMRRVRWKIMLPYAVLTLVCAALATYSVTRLITSSLEERFDKQIVEAARVTSDSVVRRERLHLSALRSVAFTEGVSDAVAGHDSRAVERLVRPVVSNAKAERVDVLDLNARPLFSPPGSPIHGPSPTRTKAISPTTPPGPSSGTSWRAATTPWAINGRR